LLGFDSSMNSSKYAIELPLVLSFPFSVLS
jgi:hypothetical protein